MKKMLSKKYYEMIAKIIRESPDKIYLMDRFVEELKRDNPDFDEIKFKEACNPDF